jgi:hypothetical protein
MSFCLYCLYYNKASENELGSSDFWSGAHSDILKSSVTAIKIMNIRRE